MAKSVRSSMRARRLVEVSTVRTSGPFWKTRAQAGQDAGVGAGHGQELLGLVHQQQQPPAAAHGAAHEGGQHVADGQPLEVLDARCRWRGGRPRCPPRCPAGRRPGRARRRCPAGPSRGRRTGVCGLCWTRYSSSFSRLVLPRRRAPTTQSESRSPSRISRRMAAAAEEVLAAHPAPGDEGVSHRPVAERRTSADEMRRAVAAS